MSPMKRNGISTAISDTVKEMIVKPICFAPLARLAGACRLLRDNERCSDHHDCVIDHESGSDRQCHQRQIVEAEAEQIHRAERADEGKRHGHAGNDRGAQVSQEQKDAITTSAIVSMSENCTSLTEAPNCGRAVGQNRNVMPDGKVVLSCGKSA